MGARISKEALEKPKKFPPGDGEPKDDPFELRMVSPSRFWCLVQQAALWSDYYAIYDQRRKPDYDKNHIAMANPASNEGDDLSWAWDMIVLIYGRMHTDPAVAGLVTRLAGCDGPPKAVYVLEGSFSYFSKRYKIAMHKSDCADSLPGPVELVPPTATYPGTYAIHRVHFLRSKAIISRLFCTTIINISSRRLFVKTPGINLENTAFDDDPSADDFVTTIYMKYAGQPPKRKGKGNILVVDESGCDYASILAGWHLVKHHKIPLDDAVESVTARTGFLDTWYSDVLTSWAS